jgi:hypothetical protein
MEVIFAKNKDVKNYPPNKKFVTRLEKARQEEEYKKSRMYSHIRSKSLVTIDANHSPVFFN